MSHSFLNNFDIKARAIQEAAVFAFNNLILAL